MQSAKARRRRRRDIFLIVALSLSATLQADEPRPVSVNDDLPFGQSPIDYWRRDENNPVVELQRRIEAGDVELPYVEKFGYLPAILKELKVPVESQLLRFFSGSPHKSHITAERPRAMYFNDEVAIAWHPGSVLIEISAQDAQKGILFYTLVNREDAVLEFHRASSQACLGCHNRKTGVAVPGHFLTAQLGEQAKNYFFGHVASHSPPLELRWEFRYLTGIKADQRHRGNLSRPEDQRRNADDPTYHRVIFDLADEFDTDRYLTNTSDVAAHLIFDHQMLGQNLLARYSYEFQLHVKSDIEALLVQYLLLAEEAPLDHPLAGKSAYAAWYQAQGEKVEQGRSLHDLDLETRLFRHRISPLIAGRMVENLPSELRRSLIGRLNAVLTGAETLDGYAISDAERQATVEVFQATVNDWPR